MVKCPECAAAIDLDEDEVEEGEIMTCPECEVELEVVSKQPVQLNSLSDEDEDLDEDESLDEEDELGDDIDEDEEEEE
jgi:lysine biosynthesis protein LysW